MGPHTLPNRYAIPIQAIVWLARIGFKLYFRQRCLGRAHLIQTLQQYGQVIAISNHASNLDLPAFMACLGNDLLPYFSFPGKKELFEKPMLAWLLRGVNAFPLEREIADVTAARTLIRVLRAGKSIGITPEGTRSPTGEILPFKSGFVKLALKFNLPILPAVVVGTNKAMPKGTSFPRPARITTRIGEPMILADYAVEGSTEAREEALAEIVRQEIIRLYEMSV